jgi:hypothetical protein
MAVRGTIESPIPFRRRTAPQISVSPPELWPGFFARLKDAVANSRARRHLADSTELAEQGRSTGARV